MTIDRDKVDEYALALLFLSSYQDKTGYRAWKGFDWDTMARLHEKGLISNPKSKSKSVRFTDQGYKTALTLFERFFQAENGRSAVPQADNGA